MTFQPFVPIGGVAGWRFLERTVDTQRAAHSEGVAIKRDLDYFRENIGKIDTAEELVSDFRLLSVALGAFGLGDDIGSKFLIRKVLEEGTIEPESLANRLSDKRYRDLSSAFGFGDFDVPSSKLSTFADTIEARYLDRKFEEDMGQTNETMRLALNAQRELPELAGGSESNRTKWFNVMGNPPLRKVMETALGLPTAFATFPVDRQIEIFLDRSESIFGTNDLSELVKEETLDRVLDRFTALDDISGGPVVSSPALVLLRGF